MVLPKIMAVKWRDARSTDVVQFPDEFRTFEPIILWSVGWGFQKENGDAVIAQTYSPLDVEQVETYRHTIVIPKEYIKEIIVFDPNVKLSLGDRHE